MDFRGHVVRRWWVVGALAALAFLGAALALVAQDDERERTVHFVLRPDASVSNDDLPGALDALESDGPLVQSVIGVLGGDEMLRRAAADAGVPDRGDFEIETAGRPGSALIDSTLTASSDDVLDPLAAAYARAASDYVGSSYSAYVLARLSIDSGGGGAGPSAAQILILAALAGALLGVALVAAEPRLRRGVQALAAEVPHARRPPAPEGGDGRPPTRPRVVEPLDVRPREPLDVRPREPLDVRPREPVDVRPREPVDVRARAPLDVRPPAPLDDRPPAPLDVRPPKPVAVEEPVAVPDPATRKAPARRPKAAPRAKPVSPAKPASRPKAAAEPKTTAKPKRTTRPRRATNAKAASEPRAAGPKAAAKPKSETAEASTRASHSEPVSGPNGASESKPASGSRRKPATPAEAVPDEHEG